MKIALIGYGKMGKEIEKVARSRGHEIVCIIDINNQDDFESEAFKSADVAIEFTNPMVAYSNYMKAFKAGVKLVSGSTGWMAEHGEEIKKLCTEGGKTLFWSSNFSLGVSIFSALNKYLAKIMNQFPAYDVTMSETHHIHKLDAPSGTAITLAEGILEKIDRKDKWVKGTFLAPDGTISGTVSATVICPRAMRKRSLITVSSLSDRLHGEEKISVTLHGGQFLQILLAGEFVEHPAVRLKPHRVPVFRKRLRHINKIRDQPRRGFEVLAALREPEIL